jgi:Prokaryotic membrane lipoprotein lipid attachment site
MNIHKMLIVITLALVLAGCQTARQDRILGGSLIGGGAGALIGGLAGRSAGAALAGGVIGAAAGAIIADATRPGWCYYYKHHRKHWVRCR